MIRLLRIYRIIRELQMRQAFVAMTVTNSKLEIVCYDGYCNVSGDEYTALRVLNGMKESERRGLEWAARASKSGRIHA